MALLESMSFTGYLLFSYSQIVKDKINLSFEIDFTKTKKEYGFEEHMSVPTVAIQFAVT